MSLIKLLDINESTWAKDLLLIPQFTCVNLRVYHTVTVKLDLQAAREFKTSAQPVNYICIKQIWNQQQMEKIVTIWFFFRNSLAEWYIKYPLETHLWK